MFVDYCIQNNEQTSVMCHLIIYYNRRKSCTWTYIVDVVAAKAKFVQKPIRNDNLQRIITL